ncbi:NAD(P)-dependent dehydrogenase, short-chain alcohol dehydrogenase family [Amycolatopsis marina]|uniref:NAD(P)-dependent dehydrogenase, short-chain alcohol dehydrogenase family n=1 Tax=Amycolatopsis marina TaxID=490629 RepID=A0A1I1AGT7_9PSEU|nr:oxidoreductase [Amycolatopsis marina]SFB35708.1 NAD(P)-dependent dehydrogenase, short-chain alcohol dehydrogenase family [Amycolatopsis marina]
MAAVTAKWTEDQIPDQSGRTALVTGANSGLGLRTAQVLAAKGARVLIACRSQERGEQAARGVAAVAATKPELVRLDLADLSSVRSAAERTRELTGDSLDLLINNAGVMGTPRGVTKDGFETQFGTNHLGHAALTWLLMPAVRGAAGQHGEGERPRIVTVSSMAAGTGRFDLDDPNFEHRRYSPAAAYGQAKLANQIFAIELDRRLRAAGDDILSVAAHPGYTRSQLGSSMARSYGNRLLRTAVATGIRIGEFALAQTTRMGTLPQLYAATAPGVASGEYVGPNGPRGMRGHPVIVAPLGRALPAESGSGLWELTARLTGITPDPA